MSRIVVVLPWLTDYKYQFLCDLSEFSGMRIIVYSFKPPKAKLINEPKVQNKGVIRKNGYINLIKDICQKDSVIVGMLHLMSPSSIPMLLSIMFSRKVLLWESGYKPDRLFSSVIFSLKVKLYKLVKGVIFYNEHGKLKYEHAGFDGPSYVAVNTVKVLLHEDLIRVSPNVSRLVYLGGVTKKKGVLTLIDAVRELNEGLDNQGFSLTIIGQCVDKSILDRMEAEEFCYFKGPLYGSALLEALESIDTLVMPGLGGLAVNHGLAMGKIVVAHQGDGTVHDLLSHCPSFILNNGSRSEIIDKLGMIMHIPHDEVLSLKKSNARIFKEKFSYELMLKNFNYAIKSCV